MYPFSKRLVYFPWTHHPNPILSTGPLHKSCPPLQLSVKSLSDDLQDGLVLIAMLETLAAPKKVGPYNKNPKIKPQLIENLNAVFKFLAKENVKVVNISESDVA